MKRPFRNKTDGGYAALTATILILIVSLTVIGGLSFFTFQEVNTNRAYLHSAQSHYISEAGMEDAIYRILAGKQINSGETLGMEQGTAEVTVSTLGSQRIVRSEGKQDKYQKNLETIIDITVTGSNFLYGVEVGEGGLTMKNGSRVNGSVYSAGDITGASGAVITGDAFVSSDSASLTDQSWEIQNSDMAVGKIAGSSIAVADSTDDVGKYSSIALGADNLPRVSYYDGTGQDLKFIRCLDADCVGKNITAADSGGTVGLWTSLALGSDGLARISYYDASNGDLKFARCTDEDCASKTLTTIDSGGLVGFYTSLAIGSDGMARISYYDLSNGDLKFVRCTSDDCASKNITAVDSGGNVGLWTSLALGSDGLARISYYDDTNRDLKFAHCTNADCTARNINAVDAPGGSDIVGKWTSLALGSDGLARISYYDDTNQDLKFARCTDADCSAKILTTADSTNISGEYTSIKLGTDQLARISYYGDGKLKIVFCASADCTAKSILTPDPSGATTGQYTSLVLGADNFPKVSYYDVTNKDLKLLRCGESSCSAPSDPQVDAAQSFRPSADDSIPQVDLFLRKVGSPSNATLRLLKDSGGSPSTNPSDELASANIDAAALGSSYSWINLFFSSPPTLTANTAYWLVIDAQSDNSNYYEWGRDISGGYLGGSAKKSVNWAIGNWSDVTGDLNFRTYLGSAGGKIQDLTINGNAHAHTLKDLSVGGNANGYTITQSSVTGNAHADTLSNCTVSGNALYNTVSSCVILGSQTSPTTPPADPVPTPLPIADSTLDEWKADAAAGGTCAPPQCDTNGNFKIDNGQTASLGPKKITGKLEVDNGATLTVTGTLWVVGDIILSNNCVVRLDPGYQEYSGIILTDGKAVISNNCAFQGSGNPQSFVLLLSAKDSPGEEIMTIDNNTLGVIYYAGKGRLKFSNNAQAKQATAYGITLDNNALLTYDTGLADIKFSAGPSGGYDIKYWKEVE